MYHRCRRFGRLALTDRSVRPVASTGSAIASANTAALPPGLSAANFPTGTTFVSAGAEADPSVAGAVSTDATLAPTGATAAPTGANLAANAAPAAPVANAAVSPKSPSVGGYTAGTLGAMMHDCVKWVFTGQRALKQAQEWQTVLEFGATKASRRSRCPFMPSLKVHHDRGEPRGRDCTHIYKNHSTV